MTIMSIRTQNGVVIICMNGIGELVGSVNKLSYRSFYRQFSGNTAQDPYINTVGLPKCQNLNILSAMTAGLMTANRTNDEMNFSPEESHAFLHVLGYNHSALNKGYETFRQKSSPR